MRLLRIIDCFYLLLLGIGIGGIIACGAFAAPVVFTQIHEVLPDITQAQSGLIMGKIFMRLNVYLKILLFVMVIYEIFSLLYNYFKFSFHSYYKMWSVSAFILVLTLINAVCIGLFVWYYTPFILDVNNLIKDNFVAMHTQSVWVFKILMVSMSILFIWRIFRL